MAKSRVNFAAIPKNNMSGYQFAALPPSAGRPRSPQPTLQARTKTKGVFQCSACEITYRVREGVQAHCPLCEAHSENERLRDTIYELTNAQNMVLNDLDRARAQIDNLYAMKQALEATSVEDLAWVKQALYRWQADRGRVAIRPVHAAPQSKSRNLRQKAPVNGFVAIFRDGSEAETYNCNSVGGVALAGYLEEATALIGQIKAVEMLARAVMSQMPGGIE